MQQLSQLQSRFQEYILNDSPAPEQQAFIVDDAVVGAAKRLSIYHDAYRFRLIQALSDTYPNLQRLMGDEFFEKTARGYISKHPSATRNMRWYGGQMADYLAETLPQHPIAAELAQFEWALTLAFDAENTNVISIEDLSSIALEDWGRLRFTFHPSIQLLPMHCNTIEVWKSLDAENDPPAISSSNQANNWLVWRKNLDPHFRSLDSHEFAAINMAINGDNFAELCTGLHHITGDEEAASLQAAQFMGSWLQDQLIIAFNT